MSRRWGVYPRVPVSASYQREEQMEGGAVCGEKRACEGVQDGCEVGASDACAEVEGDAAERLVRPRIVVPDSEDEVEIYDSDEDGEDRCLPDSHFNEFWPSHATQEMPDDTLSDLMVSEDEEDDGYWTHCVN